MVFQVQVTEVGHRASPLLLLFSWKWISEHVCHLHTFQGIKYTKPEELRQHNLYITTNTYTIKDHVPNITTVLYQFNLLVNCLPQLFRIIYSSLLGDTGTVGVTKSIRNQHFCMQVTQNKIDPKFLLNAGGNAKIKAYLSKFWVCPTSTEASEYLESWNKSFRKIHCQ